MNNDVQELTRVKNALARIHEAQARLKLEEQYYINELLQLAQKGSEGHGHDNSRRRAAPERSQGHL